MFSAQIEGRSMKDKDGEWVLIHGGATANTFAMFFFSDELDLSPELFVADVRSITRQDIYAPEAIPV